MLTQYTHLNMLEHQQLISGVLLYLISARPALPFKLFLQPEACPVKSLVCDGSLLSLFIEAPAEPIYSSTTCEMLCCRFRS